ncbi:MAG: hypothetical protein IT210_16295 [Armatimonadetes bacterium]|nr:hypothetical protein [Armatimonadota bacterium]
MRPEELAEAVVVRFRRETTEARLQLVAAERAREKAGNSGAAGAEIEVAARSLAEMEDVLRALERKRDALTARIRSADARLALERAMLEAGQSPARVALDFLADRALEAEAEAEAVAKVRNLTGGGGG